MRVPRLGRSISPLKGRRQQKQQGRIITIDALEYEDPNPAPRMITSQEREMQVPEPSSYQLPIQHDPQIQQLNPQPLYYGFEREDNKEDTQQAALQRLKNFSTELLKEREYADPRLVSQDISPYNSPEADLQKTNINGPTKIAAPKPQQSPYYVGLVSPLSCMSSEQVLRQVDDEIFNSTEARQEEEEAIQKMSAPLSASQEKPVDIPLSVPRVTTPQTSVDMQIRLPSTGNHSQVSHISTYSPRIELNINEEERDPPPPDCYDEPFDIQKNLERQLAYGSDQQLPASNEETFDNHSFILHSGSKSLESKTSTQQLQLDLADSRSVTRLDQMVTIVPSDSINLEEIIFKTRPRSTSSHNIQSKPLPPKYQFETVDLDNGLLCVDPNNMESQMKEALTPKKQKEAVPTKREGRIVDSQELMKTKEPKRKGKIRFGGKLRHLLHDTFGDSTKSASRCVSTNKNNASGSHEGSSRNSSKENENRDDDNDEQRAWTKKTMEQENFKITKVLGANCKSELPPKSPGRVRLRRRFSAPPPIERVTSDAVTIISTSGGAGNGFREEMETTEVVMTAEERSPFLRLPKKPQQNTPQEDSSIEENLEKPTQQTTDVNKEASSEAPREATVVSTFVNQEDTKGIDEPNSTNKKHGLKAIAGAMVHRLKHRDTTSATDATKKVIAPKQEQFPVPTKQPGTAVNGDTRQTIMGSNNLMEESRRSVSPVYEPTGSFCLGSPSLETLNSYRMNEVLSMFTHEKTTGEEKHSPQNEQLGLNHAANGMPRISTIESGEDEIERRKKLLEAKAALMFSLKHQILTKIQSFQKREKEAAKDGEGISKEEKRQLFEEVRQLHSRRQALERLDDDKLLRAYNSRMVSASKDEEADDKNKEDVGKQAAEGPPSIDQIPRKSVTFMQEAETLMFHPEASYQEEDDDLGSPRSSQVANKGLLAWAQCIDSIDVEREGCVNANMKGDKDTSNHSVTISTVAQPPAFAVMGAAALKAVELVAKSKSIHQARNRVLAQMTGQRFKCVDNTDIDDNDSDSGIRSPSSELSNEGQRKARRQQPRKDKKEKMNRVPSSENADRLNRALAQSKRNLESRGSFETRDTRETGRTDYTEDTRDTYDTRDTRDSCYSDDTRSTYDTRSREDARRYHHRHYGRRRSPPPRRRSPHRRRSPYRGRSSPYRHQRQRGGGGGRQRRLYETISYAGSEYTEDTFEDYGGCML